MSSSHAFGALYDHARAATLAARASRAEEEPDPAETVRRVTAARDALLADVLEAARERIPKAAAEGRSGVAVLEFNGGDFREGVSVLGLVRGPRPMEPAPSGMPAPLLDDLRAAMAPFQVHHDWDGVTEGNRLMCRWMAPEVRR